MTDRMHKFLEAAAHWMMAGIIAAVIAWVFIDNHVSERKPCIERPCFAMLDARISSIETEIQARTEDRYRGSDAKRDNAAIRAEIHALRLELNKRIDAQHTGGIRQ